MPSREAERTGQLAYQALQGTLWVTVASLTTMALGFIRLVLLARFLLPEHFGAFALALVFVVLAHRLRSLNIPLAILHKQDGHGVYYRTFLAVHALTLGFATLVFLAVSPLIASFYPRYPSLTALMNVLFVVYALAAFGQIQEALLQMSLHFRKLALLNVCTSFLMTCVGPYLAWRGWGVWSLVAQETTGILVRTVVLWGPWRVGPAALAWDRSAARWLFRFGTASWVSENVNSLLERFDDFWVGTILGSTALGFYSRAYEFARYPSRALVTPLVVVVPSVIAQLQHDREALSRALLYTTAAVVHVGLAVTGLTVLLAPEFVHYVLTPKWAPLVPTLQVISLFLTAGPLFELYTYILPVLGQPEVITRARLVQLGFLLPTVAMAAKLWGINGVAAAVDGMLLVGVLFVSRHMHRHLAYSLSAVVRWPCVACVGALLLAVAPWGIAALTKPLVPLQALVKGLLFCAAYGAILLLTERDDVQRTVAFVAQMYSNRPRGLTG